MKKLRVLYILSSFPQISQTYIRSEIEALSNNFDLRVVALNEPDTPYKNHHPYQHIQDCEMIKDVITEFRPDVLHTHWLLMTRTIGYFAGFFHSSSYQQNIPFTIRAHSFDILDFNGKYVRESAPIINSDLCLGVLSFPFTRLILEKEGIDGCKIFDCYPVVNYNRFYDMKTNGDDIMNVGACIPKKGMEDFLKIATAVPNLNYDLYALGYQSKKIEQLNKEMGYPVKIIPPVQPEDMPGEYKRHRWLVYTASRNYDSVGWPVAVAEAQASGLGVCFPNIRPDLKEYVGEAGYLYNSINEVADIISKPYPEEKRQLGFIQAAKSDIFEHIKLLSDLWSSAFGSNTQTNNHFHEFTDEVVEWGKGDSIIEFRQRMSTAISDLNKSINDDNTLIIIADDPCQVGIKGTEGPSTIIPFLERDGKYWGPPADDDTAIRELERLRISGAKFMVFGWPSFWWLDYYVEFHRYLNKKFKCILENDCLLIFDLRL